MNKFNMPTNKTAADALLKELQKQKISLTNKIARMQRDHNAGIRKKEKIDCHLRILINSKEKAKASLEQIRKQETTINSSLPYLYNNRSAARNARLKVRKSAKKKL